MPDFDLLDAQLSDSRRRLLDRIEQPELPAIRRRVRRIRHRRYKATATFAAVLTGIVAVGALTAREPRGGPEPVLPAMPRYTMDDPPAQQDIWSGGGVRLLGRDRPVLNIAGEIVDTDFADPRHGYVLTACVDTSPCPMGFAATSDGQTWELRRLPEEPVNAVRAISGTEVIVSGNTRSWHSADGGAHWRLLTNEPATEVRAIPPGARVLNGCRKGALEMVLPGGRRATLRIDEHLHDCVVAPDPVSGSVLLAGRYGGSDQAAVYSVGPDGTEMTAFTDPAASVRLAVRGQQRYLFVLNESVEIVAVHRSSDGGNTWQRIPGNRGDLHSDPVVLPDGRLLAVFGQTNSGMYVSSDGGATFTRLDGIPPIGGIRAIPGGWLAERVIGYWIATSLDGLTWRKCAVV